MADTKNLKKVIVLLRDLEMDHKTDFRDIVYDIAQHDPAVLISAVNRIKNPPVPHWMEEVKDALNRDKHIEALKLYRTGTGSDLKTAKEAVDKMPEYHALVERRRQN